MLQSLLALTLLTVSPQQGVLDGDARFGKLISVRAEVKPVEAVLKEIGSEVGADLQTAAALKNDLVILLANSLSARDVLTQIAKHFGWEWTRDGDIFRLVRQPGADAKEAIAVSKQAIQPLLDRQAEFKADLAKNKPVDAVAIKAEMDALQKQIHELEPKDPNATDGWQKLQPLFARLEKLRAQLDPYARFAKTVYANLSEKLISQIESRGRIVLSYRPTPSQSPLPGPANNVATQLVDELVQQQINQNQNPPPPDPSGEYQTVESIRSGGMFQQFSSADVATVRICIEGGEKFGGGGYIRPTVVLLSRSGQILAEGYPNLWNQADPINEEPQTAPYKPDPKNGKLNEPLTRSRELKSTLDNLGGSELSMISYMSQMMDTEKRTDPLQPVALAFIQVAEGNQSCLIADAYDNSVPFTNSFNTAGDSSAELLSNLSDSIGSEFSYDGKWISIRSNDWELKRASTVPRDILFQYRDLCAKQSGLTIDQLAELSMTLTDWQYNSEALMIALGPATMGTLGMGNNSATLYLLRAWASFSPIERLAFAKGESISWNNLNMQSKNYLGEFLFRDGNGDSGFADMFDVDSLTAAEAVPPIPAFEMKPGQDKEITQLLPTGPLPGSSVSVEFTKSDAVTVQFKAAGKSFPMTMPLGAFASMKMFVENDQSAGIPIDMSRLKPGVAEKLIIKMQLLPDLSRKGSISSAVSVDGSSFGSVEDLPEGLKKKLKDQEAKIKKLRDGMGRGEPPPPPPPPPF